MHRKQEESRFLFRANAVALGGQLHRPTPEILDSQASSTLAITGGYGSARVENYRHREIVSFKAGFTQVTGSKSADGTHFNTLATSTVEGLSIAGILTADLIVGRISTMHPANGGEPEISPLGSRIVGLKVAGCDVEFDNVACIFAQQNTFNLLQNKFREDAEFRTELEKSQSWGNLRESFRHGDKEGAPSLPQSKGFVPCSVISNLRCADNCVELHGSSLVIPHFGVVHLGELLVSDKSRRLTMVRVELGCPVDGSLTVSAVEGDGHTYP